MSFQIKQNLQNDSELDGHIAMTGTEPFEIHYVTEGHTSRLAIEILSLVLVDSLKNACMNYPGTEYQKLYKNRPVFFEPFMLLFYNRDRIQELASTAQHAEKDALDQLLGFMIEQNSWVILNKLEALTCRIIAFQDLWLLYRPGTTVYQHVLGDSDTWRAYKTRNVSYHDHEGDVPPEFRVVYYSVAFDKLGEKLEPQKHVSSITLYVGARWMVDLDLVPEEFMPVRQVHALRAALEKRGRKYWSFNSNPCYQQYVGSEWRRSPRQEALKVMIDCISANKCASRPCNLETHHMPIDGCSCSVCVRKYAALPFYPAAANDAVKACLWDMYPMLEPHFTHDDIDRHPPNPFLYCPPHIDAFAFQHKTWRLVEVSSLNDIEESQRLWDTLFLPERSKLMLDARIDAFLNSTAQQKTRYTASSLTILIQGPPGTGKTMIPEAIAEAKRRPLYVISWCDLFSESYTEFCRILRETLSLIDRWGAILVIDHADTLPPPGPTTWSSSTFKSEYSNMPFAGTDMYKSALLDRLSSHVGITFLLSIDSSPPPQVLRSLIHLSIATSAFNSTSQRKAWTSLVKAIPSNEDREALHKLTNVLASYNLNGHQLQNCLRTALALASRKGELPIRKRHVELALSFDADFMASANSLQLQEILNHLDASDHGPGQNQGHSQPQREYILQNNDANAPEVTAEDVAPRASSMRPALARAGSSNKSVHFRPLLSSTNAASSTLASPHFPTVSTPSAPSFTSSPFFTTLEPLTPDTTSIQPNFSAVPMTPRPPNPAPTIIAKASAKPQEARPAPKPDRTSAALGRPGILRRHTTQSSSDAPVTAEKAKRLAEDSATGKGGWTWRMLPATVRRPQLEFERGLPDRDTDGENEGAEGKGDEGDESEGGDEGVEVDKHAREAVNVGMALREAGF